MVLFPRLGHWMTFYPDVGCIRDPDNGIDRTGLETETASRTIIGNHYCSPPVAMLGPVFHNERIEEADWRTAIARDAEILHDFCKRRMFPHEVGGNRVQSGIFSGRSRHCGVLSSVLPTSG